jgi:hypothetical protein
MDCFEPSGVVVCIFEESKWLSLSKIQMHKTLLKRYNIHTKRNLLDVYISPIKRAPVLKQSDIYRLYHSKNYLRRRQDSTKSYSYLIRTRYSASSVCIIGEKQFNKVLFCYVMADDQTRNTKCVTT